MKAFLVVMAASISSSSLQIVVQWQRVTQVMMVVAIISKNLVFEQSARPKKCPGCHLSHHVHKLGQPHIDCKGPASENQPESEIDKPCLVPGLSSLDVQI